MAVVAAILAVVIALVVPGLPRTVRVSYRLPSALSSLDVKYENGNGEVVRAASFSWSGESPELLRHEPELAPGRYAIDVTIERAGGSARHLRRTVEIDPGRITRVDLREAD